MQKDLFAIFKVKVTPKAHVIKKTQQLHNFIDFKKAFDRVWHAGPWQVLRSYNIDGVVQAIQALHENSSSAVLLNSQLGEFFKTTVGVRQEFLLSSILLNLFLAKIMQETLYDHHTSISIGRRPVRNLRLPTADYSCGRQQW